MTPFLENLFEAGQYIRGSVHFSKRRADKAFEIVGRLTNEAYEELDINAGPEVVLDVAYSRDMALKKVRFLRGNTNNNDAV